jgi:hypothetical protein
LRSQTKRLFQQMSRNGRMGVSSKREMQAREQPGVLKDTGERHRVGEGDEHSRRLFVADEFARQAGRVQQRRQPFKRFSKSLQEIRYLTSTIGTSIRIAEIALSASPIPELVPHWPVSTTPSLDRMPCAHPPPHLRGSRLPRPQSSQPSRYLHSKSDRYFPAAIRCSQIGPTFLAFFSLPVGLHSPSALHSPRRQCPLSGDRERFSGFLPTLSRTCLAPRFPSGTSPR